MVLFLRRLLHPPMFAEYEKNRRAHLLHVILGATTTLNILDMVILAIVAPETIPTFWLNGVFLVSSIISFWMLHQGMVTGAAFITGISFWGILAFYLTTSGGLNSPAFDFLNIAIIIGALLLGGIGAIAFGLICIGTTYFLYIAGNNGWISLSEPLPTPDRLIGTNTIIFLGLAILMGVSARNVQSASTRARKSEEALTAQNRQLHEEITHRKRAQQEQTRLAAILEGTSDFVGITDAQGKVLYLNRAGRKLIGISEEANVIGTTISEYHPAHIAEMLLNQAVPMATQNGTWSGDTYLLLRNGREVPVSQLIIAHYSPTGTVEYLSTIMRDISERQQAEQHRLELALQNERLASFKEFLGNITHDLRTPMTIINNSLYLLQRLEEPEQRKEKMDNIEQQIKLLDTYLQDLLTLTRLDQTSEINFTSLDLNHLLTEVHTHLLPVADAKQITLQLQLNRDISSILANEHELYRAVTNMVENAVNYTLDGGSVVIQTYNQAQGIVFQVSDTGIGIAPEELSHIFERFYRSERAQQLRGSGTGLGLAIVKRIIEVHGGRVDAESALGKGTTFRIWLPIKPKPSDEP